MARPPLTNVTDEWLTPLTIIEAFPPFDLDPCAHPTAPTRCARTGYTLPHQNGLLLPWQGSVWLNPPYGRSTIHWARRAALHGDVIMLVHNRLGSLWFQELLERAAAALFIAGRVPFETPIGEVRRCPVDSVLVAIGGSAAQKLATATNKIDGILATAFSRSAFNQPSCKRR